MTDRMPAVLLAISGAAIAFIAVMLLHLGGGISEREETRVFVLACILVPISGVVVASVFDALKGRLFRDNELFYPLFALTNAVLWISLVLRIRHALPPPQTGAQVDLRPLFRKILIMWMATNLAVGSFLALTQRLRFTSWVGARLRPWVERLVPFLIFAALLPFTMHTPPIPWKVIALLVASGGLTFVHRELDRFPRRRSARIAFDLFVVLAIFLVVFDPIGDVSQNSFLHHNFYLGPIAAVRAGKTMLVDVNCQYGVGVIYFLSSLIRFKLMDPSILGFAHVIGVFAFVQAVTWYATLRMTTRSPALSAILIAVALVVGFFEQMGFAASYPSTGGVRFLPGFLFVACIAAKARFRSQAMRLVILEALIVGAASIWSFESFVYVLVAYLGSVVYDTSHVKRGEIWGSLRDRLAPTLMAAAGWHAWLFGFTRYRSGHWPHWSYYFDYIRLYSTHEFGTLPIEPWTPWIIIGGVYAVALAALGYRRLGEESSDYKPELGVVFTMCSLGIGQYTYFLGRSHVNNLFHICLPAFFVAGYAFIRAARNIDGVSARFRRWFVFVGYGALALCFFSGAVETAQKFNHTELDYLITGSKPHDTPTPHRVQDIVDLVNRYAPTARRIALFTGSDTAVPVYLVTHKASIYPAAYSQEDDLLPAAKQRIFAFDDHLAVGDIVFFDTGTRPQRDPKHWELASDAQPIDRKLWANIEKRFGAQVVDSRQPTGIFVLQLTPR